MTEKYFLKLREDMPPGFIENERIPELPAAYTFLQQYVGKEKNWPPPKKPDHCLM